MELAEMVDRLLLLLLLLLLLPGEEEDSLLDMAPAIDEAKMRIELDLNCCVVVADVLTLAMLVIMEAAFELFV